jgi:hypothetical protein
MIVARRFDRQHPGADAMLSAVLPVNDELSHRSRLRAISSPALHADWLEVSLLLLMGVIAAALTAFVQLRMRVPGYVILFGVVPMSCGLAVAPRRRAGGLMSVAAIIALFGFGPAAAMSKITAIVSLALLGPLLDWAARLARSGKTLYFAFAAAGLASNAAAFVAKALEKRSGANPASRPYAEWISVAPVSFAICGIVAGLIGAGLFFQFSEATTSRPQDLNA